MNEIKYHVGCVYESYLRSKFICLFNDAPGALPIVLMQISNSDKRFNGRNGAIVHTRVDCEYTSNELNIYVKNNNIYYTTEKYFDDYIISMMPEEPDYEFFARQKAISEKIKETHKMMKALEDMDKPIEPRPWWKFWSK